MTNITIETMTVYDDREKRIVRVTVTDLEANVPYSQDITIAKTIERRQSKGWRHRHQHAHQQLRRQAHILEATDDDIVNKQQALISKRRCARWAWADPRRHRRRVHGAGAGDAGEHRRRGPDAAKRKLFDAFGQLWCVLSS